MDRMLGNPVEIRSTNIVIFCLLCSLATSSFDIFLVIPLGGFSLRFSQFILWLPILVLAGKMLRSDFPIRLPVGFSWVVVWLFFIFFFIPNTSYYLRSIGWAGWLALDILIVFVFVQYFSQLQTAEKLIRAYIISFFIVAVFGIAQFFLPILHLGAPLVQQWWVPDIVPRANGFSFEPSYFATYLILGWVLTAYLLEYRSKLMSSRQLKIMFATITIALLLSTSRIGIMVMLLWSLRYLRYLPHWFQNFSTMRMSFGKTLVLWNSFALMIAMVAGFVWVFDIRDAAFLLGGTGLFDTADHSVGMRMARFTDTFAAFFESPFIGYSIGGIAPAIGELHGEIVSSNLEAKVFEGMNIFAEVLAASGLIGAIPFFVYIGRLIAAPILLARKVSNSQAILLRALVWAFVAELFILQFNQNILRPYFWYHVAVLSAFYGCLNLQISRNNYITSTTQRSLSLAP